VAIAVPSASLNCRWFLSGEIASNRAMGLALSAWLATCGLRLEPLDRRQHVDAR
jgi:hypothetical protein